MSNTQADQLVLKPVRQVKGKVGAGPTLPPPGTSLYPSSTRTQTERGANEPREGHFVPYRHIFETFLTARSILCLTSCTKSKQD